VVPMEQEFNSPTRQSRARDYLKRIRMSKVQADEGLYEAVALDRIREIITSMVPQYPAAHRTEESKVELLHDAVIGPRWASEPLS
jgi:hypothetical protein